MTRDAIMALTLLWASHGAAAPLKFLNWEDYLAPQVIELWQKQSGHLIEQLYIDDDEKRDMVLVNAKSQGIDLAVVDEISAKALGRKGELLDLSSLNSRKHIAPTWLRRCGTHAVPYFWGTIGIAYRSDKIPRPSSWRDLLEPKETLKGHISMLSDYQDTLSPALILLGHSANTGEREALSQAYQLLVAQADSILTYEYPITFLQYSPRASELHMALVYSGDEYTMNELAKSGELWRYTIPEEGTAVWVDCLAVSAHSKHADAALAFIDFVLQPQVAALNAKELGVATPNQSALSLLPQEITEDSNLYPKASMLQKSHFYEELDQKNLLLRQRITSALERNHDSH